MLDLCMDAFHLLLHSNADFAFNMQIASALRVVPISIVLCAYDFPGNYRFLGFKIGRSAVRIQVRPRVNVLQWSFLFASQNLSDNVESFAGFITV